MLLPGFLCLMLVVVTSVSAYIPALPTNDTNIAIAGGLNVTDVSKLYLQWSNGFASSLLCGYVNVASS
jgi:hypothetical protein